MTGYVADLSWKSGVHAIEKLDWDKVDAGDFKHELLNRLRSTMAVNVLTWLSWYAQSGRWSSFGKRVWFSESNIVLVISYYLLFYLLNLLFIKWRKAVLYQVKKLNHILLT